MQLAAAGNDDQRRPVLPRAEHASARADFHARAPYAAGQGPSDLRKVHDPRLGNPKCGEPRDLGLELPQLLPPELPDAREPIRPAAPLQLRQRRELRWTCGHDELAIAPVRDAFVGAKLEQRVPSLTAHPRLERIGLVVQTGMNHAAVMTALVCGKTILGLEEYDRDSAAVGQRQRRRETDQA